MLTTSFTDVLNHKKHRDVSSVAIIIIIIIIIIISNSLGSSTATLRGQQISEQATSSPDFSVL